MEDLDDELIDLATRIYALAREGATHELVTFLDAGVSANLTNDKGDCLVMLAAYHGHAQTVSALLAKGGDPDRANDRGQTPLAGAVFKGEMEVIEVLLAAGADPDAGRPTARQTASMFERRDILEQLSRATGDG